MPEQNKTFQVGDTVTWTSQAGGKSKTKTGKVAAIVRANESWRLFIPDGFKLKTDSFLMRDHESYLIQVGKSKRLYWPMVKYLEKASDGPMPFQNNETGLIDELPLAMTIHENGRIELEAD